MASLIAMVVLEVAWGADVGSALLFLGYELVFVVGPGYIVYCALASRPGGQLRRLALGFAVGSALEVFAFMITAALGARGLFTIYPLLVAAPALVALTRRRYRADYSELAAEDQSKAGTPGLYWALAALCVAAMGLLALSYFPGAPLPGRRSFAYFPDLGWHLGLAAEAKNHWPVMDPNVSGQPLPYHDFVHFHMAAASQVTGIELPQILFRLFNLPLVLATVLLYAAAGLSFARSAWVGLAAAVLVFFVGDLQLQFSGSFLFDVPFLGLFINLLDTSPSFIFGIPIFLALIIVGGELIAARKLGRRGDWILLALLMAASIGAKVVIPPVIAAAAGVLVVWKLLASRRLERAAVGIGAIAAAVMVVTYLWQYADQSSGLEIAPFRSVDSMTVVASIKAYASDLGGIPLGSDIVAIGVVALGLAGLLAPQLTPIFAGRVTGSATHRRPLEWLAAVLVVGLAALIVLFSPASGNQLYFAYYPLVAGWLLSAIGLRNLWKRRPATGAPVRAGWIALAWIALIACVAAAPRALDLFKGGDPAQTYIFVYGGLALSLALLVLAARRWLSPPGWWTRTLVCGALLIVGAAGTLSDYVVTRADLPTPPDPAVTLTPGLYEGLAWIRDSTSTDAVFAVNDDGILAFDYGGFAERQIFLEGVVYTRRALNADYEQELARHFADAFPGRTALNAAAFAGDPKALQALIDDYGVRYLIVNSAGDVPVDRARLEAMTAPVFENPSVTVLKLTERSES